MSRPSHPYRSRNWPRGLASAVLLAAAALAPAAARDEKTGCRLEAFGAGTVAAVLDGRTLALADGREVRLSGIDVPPMPARAAPADPEEAPSPAVDGGLTAATALTALVAGKDITLKHLRPASDRYGRVLAEAFVTREDGELAIGRTLVAQGYARVAARPGEPACAADLLAAERAARAAKLGLWGDPRYELRRAENPGEVLAARGRFTLVEGRVASVRESGGTIYVNFGRRWQQDFTVTIAKRNERLFTAAGLEPRKLAGRRVVVRGWIGERGGPWIEAAAPDQIEIVGER